jgi:hypothetical protein
MQDDPLEGPNFVNLLSSALTSYHHLEVFRLDLLNVVVDLTNNEALRELVSSISDHKSLKTLELESHNDGDKDPTSAPMYESKVSRTQSTD